VEGDHYTPSQAARILSRSGRKVSERRIRQMLQAGELEGEQTETGRWKIPQSVVHALLEQRRELLSDVTLRGARIRSKRLRAAR
jgi:hypothetical protein